MKWLKYGCAGCLGAMALLIVIAAGIGGLAWQRSRALQMEEQVITRELPAAPGSPAGQVVSAEALAADLAAGSVAAGAIELSLSGAEFEIAPGSPGEPLRVEASFDKSGYLLEESLQENGPQGWKSKVSFRRRPGAGFISKISEMIRGAHPKVKVLLPPDSPFALDLTVSQGGLRADLGGLWITDADFDLSMGGGDIRFNEPLRYPAGSIALKGRMGGMNFSGLGNASPRHLEIDYSMGGMSLGLNGAWRSDANVEIRMSMGGGAVILPSGVNLEGLPAEAEASHRPAVPGAPTLRFDVRKGSGELEFVTR